MELKPYQQQILADLQYFMQCVQETKNTEKAFEHFWLTHPRTPLNPLRGAAVEPYKNNIKNAPHVCIKVPTGGGKTFIASAALGTIFREFNSTHSKMVVWLVPSLTILEQTLRNLRSPEHPYRLRINTDFNNRVEVFDKAQALQGGRFSLATVKENLCILVMSYDSLRAKKKDDRKVYQENGYLQSFEPIVGKNADGDSELQLMRVLQALHPVVVVDESHNAETELSVEMLQNLSPSFILDLTATPRKNSNIISFTNAYELKKESMVKLPVIVYNHQSSVYNHQSSKDVISSALELQKRLEADALEEQKNGGRYIRPIVLFQAQPRTGEDNITFEKIKNKLLELKIPENQIRIKTADCNEIANEDLLSPQCPVRYIITVNALNEGWDCPFAYVLASLADRSSAVDVEQILGRVLRMPWVRRSSSPMLNMSYVLTASNKFLDTLNGIVKALNYAGFSDKDYRIAEPLPQPAAQAKPTVQPAVSFETPQTAELSAVEELDARNIAFSPAVESNIAKAAPHIDVDEIERRVREEAEKEKMEQTAQGAAKVVVPEEINNQVKTYKMKEVFSESAKSLKLPQFMCDDKKQMLTNEFFVELHKKPIFESEMLLSNFKLGDADSSINFESVETTMYRVDLDESNSYLPTYLKVEGAVHDVIAQYILDPSKKKYRVKNCIPRLKERIGKMYPIPDIEIELYIGHVLERFTDEQFADLMAHEYTYADKIKAKIRQLCEEYKEREFEKMVDKDQIFTEDTYQLPDEILPKKTISGLPKSLYEREEEVNSFEHEVINEVANLENVEFWTRNINHKMFYINGFINHYPDFIIKTKKGKIVLLETKGDHLEAEKKIKLGNLWANKAGNNYRYCLVYNNREVDGAYTRNGFIEVLREW